MKTFTVFVCCLVSISRLAAQPTLTAASNNPAVGNVFVNYHCNISGVSQGVAGASVTWDLSGLVTTSVDTEKYIAPSTTLYSSVFAASNLAVNRGSYFDYFIANVNTLEYSGVGMAPPVLFSDPISIVKYPITYGDVPLDSFAYSIGSTYTYGFDSIIADGWGTLILPAHTYTNVLRTHFVMYETDSDASGSSAVVSHVKRVSYYWYSSGVKNPIVEMTLDSVGVPNVNDVFYRVMNTTGITRGIAGNISADAYPNPASDLIHVVIGAAGDEAATISVFDMMSREVLEPLQLNVHQGTNDLDLSVSSLPAGMYLLRIQIGEDRLSKLVQIVK